MQLVICYQIFKPCICKVFRFKIWAFSKNNANLYFCYLNPKKYNNEGFSSVLGFTSGDFFFCGLKQALLSWKNSVGPPSEVAECWEMLKGASPAPSQAYAAYKISLNNVCVVRWHKNTYLQSFQCPELLLSIWASILDPRFSIVSRSSFYIRLSIVIIWYSFHNFCSWSQPCKCYSVVGYWCIIVDINMYQRINSKELDEHEGIQKYVNFIETLHMSFHDLCWLELNIPWFF